MIGCEIDSIALFSLDIENRFNSPEEKFSKFRVFRIREYFILWFYAVFEINITETNFAPKKADTISLEILENYLFPSAS